MKKKLSIVKIGGNIIDDDSSLNHFLSLFSKMEGPKLLVHGGGKLASQLSKQLGQNVNLINGRRITDEETLNVITMVYAGKINKSIVAGLQHLTTNAIGMSGADANTIVSVKRPATDIDFGYVGDVTSVNSSILISFLNLGLVPVFCALTHDLKGQLLNTNADTIASEIAIGLSVEYEVDLFYCFEKKGVLRHIDNELSVIEEINFQSYQQLKNEEVITDGMIPKLDNCFYAISKGVSKVCIGSIHMLEDRNTIYTTLKS